MLEFHKNESIQYVLLWIWSLPISVKFLRFNHIAACVSNLAHLLMGRFPLYKYTTICLSSHLFVDMWVVPTIEILEIKLI